MTDIPDAVYRVWGDDAVLCADEGHEGRSVWHHKDYHLPSPRFWRADAIVAWRGLRKEVRGLVGAVVAGALGRGRR